MRFISNRVDQSLVHRITHAGREYLVAPVVAIRAGVLNGELALAEEIGKYVESWNGIPVPLGHPMLGERYVSANTPDIVASCPGRFWNASFVGDKLSGEIWLDTELCKQVGGDAMAALKRIEGGKPVEVSTAYFRDFEELPGELNGVEYTGIQRNLRPDHLALLLHEIGACSWKDGCGVPRVNFAVNTSGEVVANQNTGVMIAFFLRQEDAQVLALSDDLLPRGSQALTPQEMHITLAYYGEMANLNSISQEAMLQSLAYFVKDRIIVRGAINGVARFAVEQGSEMAPIVALVDSEAMRDLRRYMVSWMADSNIYPMNNHGFTPHITLAYIPANAATPDIRLEPRDMVFEKIALAWGDQVTVFNLNGEPMETPQDNTLIRPKGNALIEALAAFARSLGFKIQKEVTVDEKTTLVQQMAANARCPLKQPALEKLDLAELQAINAAMQANCGGNEEPSANEEGEQEKPQETAQEDVISKRLEALEKSLADIHSAMSANVNQEKDALVAELVANGALDKADLEAMSVEALRKLRQAMQPASFGGRGMPRTNQADGEIVEAPMPAIE